MDEKFFQEIMRDCQEAISNTLIKAKGLLTDKIEEDVYSPETPRKSSNKVKGYVRTYTFEDAWRLGKAIKDRNSVSQSLDYDYTMMIYNGEKYVHGNEKIDRRPIMASILENSKMNGKNSDFGGALNISTNERDNYWEDFKRELDTKIYIYLDKDLGKYGIKRR